MKNKLLLRLSLLLFGIFCLHSCRTEDFLQDSQNKTKDGSTFYVSYNVKNNGKLWNKISAIQKSLSHHPAAGKNMTDSVEQGGIILTDRVLVGEKNGQKTYTFQLKNISYPDY